MTDLESILIVTDVKSGLYKNKIYNIIKRVCLFKREELLTI